MLRPYVGEMTEQRTFEPLRQHRNTIAITLAAAYCDFMLRKIDVLHAQSQCLEQAHARSIQHTRHERRRPSALEPCEHSAHLVLGQDEAILDCDAREPRTRKTRAVAAFKRAVR